MVPPNETKKKQAYEIVFLFLLKRDNVTGAAGACLRYLTIDDNRFCIMAGRTQSLPIELFVVTQVSEWSAMINMKCFGENVPADGAAK